MERGLFVSGGDTPKLHKPIDQALDKVVIPLEVTIIDTLSQAVAAKRDGNLGALCFDCGHQCIGVVAFVGNYVMRPRSFDVRGCVADVGNLVAGPVLAQRVAKGSDHGIDLGIQSAPAAPERLTAFCFLGARGVLAHSHERRIEVQLLQLGIAPEGFGRVHPIASLPAPTGKAHLNSVPRAGIRGQIAPRLVGTRNPPPGLHEQSAVVPHRAALVHLLWTQWLDTCPLIVLQHASIQPRRVHKERMCIILSFVNRL